MNHCERPYVRLIVLGCYLVITYVTGYLLIQQDATLMSAEDKGAVFFIWAMSPAWVPIFCAGWAFAGGISRLGGLMF